MDCASNPTLEGGGGQGAALAGSTQPHLDGIANDANQLHAAVVIMLDVGTNLIEQASDFLFFGKILFDGVGLVHGSPFTQEDYKRNGITDATVRPPLQPHEQIGPNI